MNDRQFTSVILSVLLASTLGHEYLQNHHIAHQAKSIHGHHHQDRSHHQGRSHHEGRSHHHEDTAHQARSALLEHQHARSNHHQFRVEEQECGWVCDGPEKQTEIKIIIRESIHLIAIVNTTAQVAIGFDFEAGLVVVLSGKTNEAFILNVKTGIGYYIKGHCWNASTQTIEVYINSLTSLSVIWELGVKLGVHVDVNGSVKTDIQKLVGQVLVALQVELVGDASAAIKLLISISKEIIITNRETIQFLITGAGNTAVGIVAGLQGFVAIIGGITTLFKEVKGGIKALIQLKIKIDIVAILAASNSIKIFALIIGSIAAKVEISTVLGDLLKAPEKLLALIANLGGDIQSGVDGIMVIIYQLIILIKKETRDVSALIAALIRYSVHSGNGSDIKTELNASITLLISVLQKASADSAKAVIEFFVAIKESRLVVNGFNVSAVITILVSPASGGALVLIVTVLIAVKGVVDVSQSLSALLLGLFKLVESYRGITILVIIIPTLKIDTKAISGGFVDVYALILANVNIGTLFSGGISIESIVNKIPIIGPIAGSCSSAVQTASKGSLQFWVIIKSNTSVTGTFIAWIKGIISRGGQKGSSHGGGSGEGEGHGHGGIHWGGGGGHGGTHWGIHIGDRHDHLSKQNRHDHHNKQNRHDHHNKQNRDGHHHSQQNRHLHDEKTHH